MDKSRFIGPILVFFQKSRQNSSRGSQSCLISIGYHQKCSETPDPVLERILGFHGCEALFHCILRFVHLNKSLKWAIKLKESVQKPSYRIRNLPNMPPLSGFSMSISSFFTLSFKPCGHWIQQFWKHWGEFLRPEELWKRRNRSKNHPIASETFQIYLPCLDFRYRLPVFSH